MGARSAARHTGQTPRGEREAALRLPPQPGLTTPPFPPKRQGADWQEAGGGGLLGTPAGGLSPGLGAPRFTSSVGCKSHTPATKTGRLPEPARFRRLQTLKFSSSEAKETPPNTTHGIHVNVKGGLRASISSPDALMSTIYSHGGRRAENCLAE